MMDMEYECDERNRMIVSALVVANVLALDTIPWHES